MMNVLHKLYKVLLIEKRLPDKVKIFFSFIIRHTPLLRFKNYKFHDFNIRYRRCSADDYALMEVFEKKVYYREGFEISDSDVVVDIGAHIGGFSLYAANFAKHGRIVSFEPMPDHFRLCKYNLSNNNIRNAEVLNLGIAGKVSDRKLYLSYADLMHSIIPNQDKITLTGKTVLIHCLDLNMAFNIYGIGKCNFLKMDCEGAEFEIVDSVEPKTWQKIDKIIVEYHECPELGLMSDKIESVLKKSGFATEKVISKIKNIGYFYAKRISAS